MNTIHDLNLDNADLVEQLAEFTMRAFQENSPTWVPTHELARQQVLAAGTKGRLGRIIMVNDEAAGWIGLITGPRVWEIHPIAIAEKYQFQGLGHQLVEDAADIARSSGALTLLASTSDETGTTNLFNADLYQNPAQYMKDLKPEGRNPYLFWVNAGFSVVGLVPDAEGVGKPSIQLARRLSVQQLTET